MNREFEPYGDEWRAELKKWSKANLITFLRTILIEQEQKIKESHKCAGCEKLIYYQYHCQNCKRLLET